MSVKIGDKIRFLNAVGGGTITGFQGKDIVLVSDADGFEIPTLLNEVVVVETDNYNLAKNNKKQKPKAVGKGTDEDGLLEEAETDLADKPLTYQPLPQERRGANKLNCLLAFVPVDRKHLTNSALEVYVVNDCNYYLYFTIVYQKGEDAFLLHRGEVAPNTKMFLQELPRTDIEQWENLTIQILAYKNEKAYAPKQPVNADMHLSASRFYKANVYVPSPFFDVPAFMLDIIKEDQVVSQKQINASEIQNAMSGTLGVIAERAEKQEKKDKKQRQSQPQNAVIEVDLHASALFDTMVGLQPKDILDYQIKVFRDTMNTHLHKRGQHIVFIHGKGEGVLRKALENELAKHYKQCKHQDASFRNYGYGATLVII